VENTRSAISEKLQELQNKKIGIVSRRDNAIVAWHEVPGTAPLESAVP
jgi:hypothetical protein